MTFHHIRLRDNAAKTGQMKKTFFSELQVRFWRHWLSVAFNICNMAHFNRQRVIDILSVRTRWLALYKFPGMKYNVNRNLLFFWIMFLIAIIFIFVMHQNCYVKLVTHYPFHEYALFMIKALRYRSCSGRQCSE